MNTVTIVLLLSMCFCALCGATPAVSSLDQVGLIPSNEVDTKLQRIARQSSTSDFIEETISRLVNIPANLTTNIVKFILSIISRIKSTFLSWIENIESFLENPLTLLNNSQNSNQRRRRSNVSNGLSDLISDLPNLLHLPVSYLQETTSSIGDSVGEKIKHIAKAIIKLVWDFIRTRLLPWLHEVLSKVQHSDILPSFLNEAIGNVDSIYSLLRLVTEITSNSS
ncbi:uncharacterized protein LOC117230534 [Bombus vosnesenskii]|uniref:Uncharacterized protein LOC117230534 n=1 Tax=Bombus vosnesenskii TaxID=207650 RepID=A0A6J3JUX6_9HYME|nr:uncharacterized protein LOC117230534 [Bombus vosnesenskii]